MISRIHYITQGDHPRDHLFHLLTALENDIDWIQLRLKDLPKSKLIKYAKSAKEACLEHGAKLIINDHVEVAMQVSADGIHLGQEDMSPSEARSILGADAIIGGTANTIEQIQEYMKEGVVDYIGLGPFAATETKKNLSPILGLEGIQNITSVEIGIPIVVVGGISEADIEPLMNLQIHGIAVSTLLTDVQNTFISKIKSQVNARQAANI